MPKRALAYFSNYYNQFIPLIQSRTIKSLSILVSSNMMVAVLGFLSSVITLRFLDPIQIATLYPLISIMMIADQFGEFGITNAFVRIGAGYLKEDPLKTARISNSVFKVKLFLAAATCIVGFFLASWISQRTFHTDDQVFWIRIVLMAAGIGIIASFYQAHLQILNEFKSLSLIKLIPPALKTGMLFLLIPLGKFNFIYVFFAFLIIPVFSLILGLLFSDHHYLKAKSVLGKDFHEVFHFSKWLLLSSLTNAFTGQVDVLMIRSLTSESEVARYLGGQRLASVLPVFSISLVTVLLPKISTYTSKKELHYFFRKWLLALPLIMIPILGIAALAPTLIPFVLGQKYIHSIDIFQVFSFQFGIEIFFIPISLILYNLNKAHVLALANLGQLLINVIGNYFLVPPYGSMGATLSAFAMRIFGVSVILYSCYREGVIFYKEEKLY